MIDSQRPHTGRYSAHLCGFNSCLDHLAQYMVVPSQSREATLSYWVYVAGKHGPSPTCQDGTTVQLRAGASQTLVTSPTLCSRDANGSWHHVSLDVSAALRPYAGRTVELYLQAWTGVSQTEFFVDDVALDTTMPDSSHSFRRLR